MPAPMRSRNAASRALDSVRERVAARSRSAAKQLHRSS
jgi:hypothetical protein